MRFTSPPFLATCSLGVALAVGGASAAAVECTGALDLSRVYTPENYSSYDHEIYNKAIDNAPGMIYAAASADDVATAMCFAQVF